jgi:hypothetical protein
MEEKELNKIISAEELKREAKDKSRTDMARLRNSDRLHKGS